MQIVNQLNSTSPFQNATTASVQSANTAGTSSSSASASSTSTATITANDFLQLLVTELQNQDPTANTDPNEYVDQLVQVNTLQQQIQMNQTLDGGPTLTGASNGVLQELVQMNQTLDGAAQSSTSGASNAISDHTSHASSVQTGSSGISTDLTTDGNLSDKIDRKQVAAAQRVASALAPEVGGKSSIQGLTQKQEAFQQFAANLRASAAKQ